MTDIISYVVVVKISELKPIKYLALWVAWIKQQFINVLDHYCIIHFISHIHDETYLGFISFALQGVDIIKRFKMRFRVQ